MTKSELTKETLERATALAKKDGVKLTLDNCHTYYVAALNPENEMIKYLSSTKEGLSGLKKIKDKILNRIYKGFNNTSSYLSSNCVAR